MALPRKWVLKGRFTGSDLGHNSFQFRFELEEDLLNILVARPYHYAHWMVILQRWEPVLSPLFPSQIPFWIRLHGLPLHYWHEKMIYDICQDLGTLEDYCITKTSAKIRVSIDALKPLVKEATIDFSEGVELPITLEYDGLEQHCSSCNSLAHLAQSCPLSSRPLKPDTKISHVEGARQTSPPLRHPKRSENSHHSQKRLEKRSISS